MSQYSVRLADLLLRSADAQAAGLRNSGQIWGSAVQSLGQLPGQVVQQQQQQQEAAQNARLRDQQVQVNDAQLAGAQREAADQGALDTAYSSGGDRAAILSSLPGHLRPTAEKHYAEMDEAASKLKQSRLNADAAEADYMGALAVGVKAFDYSPSAAMAALQHAKEAGYDVDPILQQLQQNPDAVKPLVDSLIAKSPTQQKLIGESADRSLRQQQEQRAITTAQQSAADKVADNARADRAAQETARHDKAMEARPVAGAGTPDDADAIADAIIRGDQSPETTGLYRVGAQVRASLAKKGYNQAQAITDWKATQKHLSTLNGAQQTRMAQAVDNAAHSLDVIDTLADQWKGGKFPALNKAQLALAKQGTLGQPAQQIATALEAQIADVTSELGNVYMGGNSPTDHALSLAAKNLSADWSDSTLRTMTKLARTNLQIRQNSMKNVGVAGASAGNPYAAPSGANADPLGILGGAK